MGLLHIDLFTTLDGVAQAPGAPDEDTAGGFAFVGWPAMLEPASTSGKGAVLLRYALASGVPGTGDMSTADRDA